MIRRNPTFWGRAGAGILFTCEEDNTVFLMHRSEDVEQPGTWGIPGGSVSGEGFYDSDIGTDRPTDETFWAGAQQETIEECGSLPNDIELVDTLDFVSGSFVYRNFICNISLKSKLAWTPTIELNWENDGFDWFMFDELPEDLHFGVEYILDQGFGLVTRSNPSVSRQFRETFKVDPNVDKMFEEFESLTTPNALNHRQRMWYVNDSDYAIIDLDIAPRNDLSSYVLAKILFTPPSDALADRVTRDLLRLADKYGLDLEVRLKDSFWDREKGDYSAGIKAWYDKWGFKELKMIEY